VVAKRAGWDARACLCLGAFCGLLLLSAFCKKRDTFLLLAALFLLFHLTHQAHVLVVVIWRSICSVTSVWIVPLLAHPPLAQRRPTSIVDLGAIDLR